MDGVCDFQRIANVINNASPDVVAVQEVDSVTNRSNQKYVLGEIAERTQMYACFAPAIDYDAENTESVCCQRKLRFTCRL